MEIASQIKNVVFVGVVEEVDPPNGPLFTKM